MRKNEVEIESGLGSSSSEHGSLLSVKPLIDDIEFFETIHLKSMADWNLTDQYCPRLFLLQRPLFRVISR